MQGFAFLMLLRAWGWLLPRVGVLRAVTTGGWEGLISLGQKAREEELCLHTDQKGKGISEKLSSAQLDFRMILK